MSLRPLVHYLKTPLGTTTSSDLTDVRLTVRSVETVVLGTGTLTQTVAVVAANEVRPLTDVTISITNGQFLSDATLTIASSYHRHADLITFDYTPSDIPAGRSIFIVDDRNATTLATITNASSGLLRLSLDATTNTWIVTETIDSTDTNPTFGTVSVTGTIRNAAGTEALPSYTFTGDLDTGMWHSAANELSWSVNGGLAARISSAGNLLVGSLATDGGVGVIQLPQAGANLNLWGIRYGTDVNTYRSGSSGYTIDATGGVISTGVFSAPNGTTLLPAFSFTSDRTAGLLYGGSGGVKIATSGLQSVLFSGVDQSAQFSGNVIGTTALNAFNVTGTATPFCELEVDSTSASSPRGIMSAQFSTDTGGARLHLRKARGTRATPTTVVTGDNLGRLVGTGYDGANYLEMASIYFASEGTIAATRIPTNIQFWTATNATPSVLTLAGQFNSSQQLLVTNGTAAAPSYSFTARSGDGWYSNAANQIAFATAGVTAVIFNYNAGSPKIIGNGGGYFQLGVNGDLSAVAAGTNQPITLTPSGTGAVLATAAVYASGGFGNSANGDLIFSKSSGATEFARFKAGTLNLLLGGLTTDGTGVLQLPTHTTNAGGISMGASAASQIFTTSPGIFRFSDGTGNAAWELNGAASSTTGMTFYQAGTIVGAVKFAASTSMVLATGSSPTAALTLDSSQNATFAGKATVTKPIIAVPSALTYASPTSVDVTLASVYTVTTVNATGSVTFNATAGGTAGQEMTIIITNDATSAKTITFGTNFKSTGTLTASAVSRQTTISFRSDGTNFCETSRAVLTS